MKGKYIRAGELDTSQSVWDQMTGITVISLVTFVLKDIMQNLGVFVSVTFSEDVTELKNVAVGI